jgi:uncharacterized protein (DUF305 family)
MRARGTSALTAAAVLVVTATTAALATTLTDDRAGDHGGMMSAPWQDRREDQPGWQQHGSMMYGMPGMMHGVRIRSEYGYLAEMVAHHREAVAAARQLQRSHRAEMRAFGEWIVATQSEQIDQMRRWLAAWYSDQSGRVDYQPMMRDLAGLSEDRLDRAFLQDMTMHHMTAVMMSQQLLARGVAEHPEVATLARTIRDDQHAEILQMQWWLRQWFRSGWPHSRRVSFFPSQPSSLAS